jgi:hypothetical protein
MKQQYHSINQGPGILNQSSNNSLNASFANSFSNQGVPVSKTKSMKQKYDDSYLNRPIVEESYV